MPIAASLALRSYAQDAAATNLQTQVEGSQIPFLAVVGKHDPSNTETIARETTLRLYPRTQIEVIDAGHYPTFRGTSPAGTIR